MSIFGPEKLNDNLDNHDNDNVDKLVKIKVIYKTNAHSSYTYKMWRGNQEFARRKVKVSSEESRTLLRGKPESVKTQKKAALRLPCNLVNNINLSY